MRHLRFLCLLAVAIYASAVASFAQDDTVVTVAPLVDFVLPIILAVISGMVAIAVAILTPIMARKFNLQIEKDRRDAIQTSLTNAASGVINKLGEQARGLKVDVRNPIIRQGVQRAINGAKDSFASVGLTQEEIAERLLEKVTQQLPPISAQPNPIATTTEMN